VVGERRETFFKNRGGKAESTRKTGRHPFVQKKNERGSKKKKKRKRGNVGSEEFKWHPGKKGSEP